MSIRYLRALFRPGAVALLGVETAAGAALAGNLLAADLQGELFLIGAGLRRVQNQPCYPHLAALPRVPELVIVADAPVDPLVLLADLDARGVQVALLAGDISLNPAQRQALAERPLRGLRLLGPDSLGVIVPRRGLNASLSPILPPPGHLALVAQSGMVLTPLLEWVTDQGLGCSCAVALGAGDDIDFPDLLDWLARDPDTHIILLHLETLRQARPFLSAARAAARIKPVLVLCGGQGGDGVSRQRDAVYEAAFQRVGLLQVASLRELGWAAATLTRAAVECSGQLLIVGNSGGLGRLAAATLLAAGGQLAELSPVTVAALHHLLPTHTLITNPLDLGAAADPARFAAVLACLLHCTDKAGVLLLHAPHAQTAAADIAAAVGETVSQMHAAGHRRALLSCWLGMTSAAHSARQHCRERGIPSYDTPDDAIRAFLQCGRYQQQRLALLDIPPAPPEPDGAERAKARALVRATLAAGCSVPGAADMAALLRLYGVALTEPLAAGDDLELVLRVVEQSPFGPVLLLEPAGPGVVLGMCLAAALPPLHALLARAMLTRSPLHALLRQADAADMGLFDGLIDLLLRVAQLVVDLDELDELALRLVWTPAIGLQVAGAQIRLAAQDSHRQRLAIRPYPRELEECLTLPDGSLLTIRPVRPEDAPAFISGFDRLSPWEVRMRFMHARKALSPSEAARLTQIDYDRDMALVALRQRPGQHAEGCGVARLVRDADGERAEFAIILLHEATGMGLSSLLLRRLIHYARSQNLGELFGEILRENRPMLELCRAMGFQLRRCAEDSGVIIATLALR
ncbi:MAG TPA: GNAT family N-acetyltransferase [Candidatus Competibacteraceae bacterium]|nr:GNAT family N-acetyltransferase [Candidatus Competibacteraceae bacterium]